MRINVTRSSLFTLHSLIDLLDQESLLVHNDLSVPLSQVHSCFDVPSATSFYVGLLLPSSR